MHPKSFFQHENMLTPIIPWKMSTAIFWAISKFQLFSSWSGDCVTTSGDISHFALSLSIMLITYYILSFSCPIFCLSISIHNFSFLLSHFSLVFPYYCICLRNFLFQDQCLPIYYITMTRISIYWLVWYKMLLRSNSAHLWIQSSLTGYQLFFIFIYLPK